MDNKIIGRFIPVGKYNDWAKPFFVLTKEPSDYLAPAWKGIMPDGEEYHVIESAWKFEPIEWGAEGLPPVGCEFEFRTNVNSSWKRGVMCVVDYTNPFNVVVDDQCGIYRVHELEFRPIRSEADKKRDEAIESIKAMLMYDYGDDPRLNDAVILYDAIAAGKIPHIRID